MSQVPETQSARRPEPILHTRTPLPHSSRLERFIYGFGGTLYGGGPIPFGQLPTCTRRPTRPGFMPITSIAWSRLGQPGTETSKQDGQDVSLQSPSLASCLPNDHQGSDTTASALALHPVLLQPRGGSKGRCPKLQ